MALLSERFELLEALFYIYLYILKKKVRQFCDFATLEKMCNFDTVVGNQCQRVLLCWLKHSSKFKFSSKYADKVILHSCSHRNARPATV